MRVKLFIFIFFICNLAVSEDIIRNFPKQLKILDVNSSLGVIKVAGHPSVRFVQSENVFLKLNDERTCKFIVVRTESNKAVLSTTYCSYRALIKKNDVYPVVDKE